MQTLHRGHTADVRSTSVLFGVLQEQRPTDHGVLATLELRDGRQVFGVLAAVDVDESTRDGGLAVVPPVGGSIRVRLEDGEEANMREEFLIFDLKDVLYVAGSYAPLAT